MVWALLAVLLFEALPLPFLQVAHAADAETSAQPSVNRAVYGAEQRIGVTEQVYRAVDGEQRKKWDKLDPNIDGELVAKRTPVSKHFLMKDGTYKAVISMIDQHYEAEDGNLYDIDTAIYEESVLASVYVPLSKANARSVRSIMSQNQAKRMAGQPLFESEFKALQVPFDTTLPKRFSSGYSISKNEETLAFKPVGASNVTGMVYGKSGLLYSNAWNSTDAILQVVDNGIKETIVLKNQDAPHKFSFEVGGPLGDSLRTREFAVQPAWLVDADGKYRDVAQSLRTEKNNLYLDIEADVSGLKFPVVIDPTVILSPPMKDGCISYNLANGSFYISNDQYTYYYTNSCSINGGALYKFDLSSISSNYGWLQAVFKTDIYLGADFNTSDDESYGYSVSLQAGKALQDWNEPSSSNDKSNPVPGIQWYSNNDIPYVNRSAQASSQPLVWDVSKAIKDIKDSGVDYGFAVREIWHDYNYSPTMQIYMGYYAQLHVNYTARPSRPALVTPNGGETLNSLYTISWVPAVDEDTPQWNLQYQIQISSNGGPWMDLVPLTAPGTTSYLYNFSGATATTTSFMRIRAFDGVYFGDWNVSDGPFTILANRAPNAPSNLTPGTPWLSAPARIPGVTPALQWIFSDPDPGDSQSAFQVVVYHSSNVAVHDSGWVYSGTNVYAVPPNVMERGHVYYWLVRTKDSFGLESPFSEARYMQTNLLPSLYLTSYTDNQTLYNNVMTFTWAYNDPDGQTQSAFQVVGTRDNWASWSYNSGEIQASSSSYVTAPLALGNWSFAIRVKDEMEWSDWAYRSNISIPNLDAGPPTVPANVWITGRTGSSVTLAWSPSTDDIGVSGYEIYNGSSLIGTSASTAYTATGLSQGALYSFTVKARDVAGNVSAPSRPLQVGFGSQGSYYDMAGKLDYIILPNGQTLDYQYDANGNLIGTAIH
ncbi:hypothetical protein GCM10020370_47240 [Paenibacillus hodogayensis]